MREGGLVRCADAFAGALGGAGRQSRCDSGAKALKEYKIEESAGVRGIACHTGTLYLKRLEGQINSDCHQKNLNQFA